MAAQPNSLRKGVDAPSSVSMSEILGEKGITIMHAN